MTRAARWGVLAWATIGLAILAYIGYRYVLYPIRIIFPPIALAIVIVYVFGPVVDALQRRKVPRLLATLLTYVVFLSLLGVVLAYLIPVVSHQVSEFTRSVPDLVFRAPQ